MKFPKLEASRRLVFQGNNESFLLKNASNLTHEFVYDNFNKKILLNCHTKLMCQI